MVILLERALYKDVNHMVKASKKEFKIAADGNLMWNNFSDKKVTIKKNNILVYGFPSRYLWFFSNFDYKYYY
ncbi:hypothetical protein QN328_04750 [Streptococcus agalactiae]|uniref:hypothetical protein n=1 Tax=Streptococcus agalactiae TaxID=1311 RepID=UPI0039788957